MKARLFVSLGVVVLGIAMVAGCSRGSKGVDTADVSGVVTLDGKPVEGISVQFMGPNHVGMGKTGPGGKYSLDTGAQPGANTVCFSPATESTPGDEDSAAQNPEEEAPKQPTTGPQIPEKYTRADTTPEKFDVPAGGTSEANFNLTSQ